MLTLPIFFELGSDKKKVVKTVVLNSSVTNRHVRFEDSKDQIELEANDQLEVNDQYAAHQSDEDDQLSQ